MMKSFTLKSKAGCKKLLALFIVLILVSSFFAQLVQTNGGTIKVEPIMIDARGAELSAELYYPAGTIGDDKLPAVIVNHGGGCIYGTMKNIAEELARRGFVVLNISAYGSGLSAQPDYDDAGQGINGFYQSLRAVEGQQSFLPTATPMGLHDAINFVRSLEMVDKENIGMVGHSMGAYRTSAAAALDCGFLTFNDIMLNILCEDFGQSFTEEEIGQNADELAKARLNDDQLAHYNALRAFEEEKFNTRLRSEIVLGIGCKRGTDCQTIENAVISALDAADIPISRVRQAATIDLKANEEGLLGFCRKYSLDLSVYSARELMNVSGDFTVSDFVKSITGVDNVCERSSVKCSQGRLIMRKTAANGVTVAASEKPLILDFERKML